MKKFTRLLLLAAAVVTVGLLASSASKPFLKVVEKEDVTYLVFRRPSKG